MRPLLVFALFAIRAGSVSAAGEPPEFKWWIADPLSKIGPLDPFPGSPLKSATLYAGRNEFEPFQIVLRPDDDRDSDLRSSQGAEISRNNITAYCEQFLNITKPSAAEGVAGDWPDALIPRT